MLTQKCFHCNKCLHYLCFLWAWLSFHKLWTLDKMSLTLSLVSEQSKQISLSNGPNRAISSGDHETLPLIGKNKSVHSLHERKSHTQALDILQLSSLLHSNSSDTPPHIEVFCVLQFCFILSLGNQCICDSQAVWLNGRSISTYC